MLSKTELAVEFRSVRFSYENEPVIERADFALSVGSLALVVGPNGGGKTTLIKLLLGLLCPNAGSIRVLGHSPAHSLARIGYVPQFSTHSSDFPITASDVVRLGLYGLKESERGEFAHRVTSALAIVGLTHLSNRLYSRLSGGERQRVLIARGLISDPELLLLDEPTNNIDFASKEAIYQLLADLHSKTTMMMVTHDIQSESLQPTDMLWVDRIVSHQSGISITNEMKRVDLLPFPYKPIPNTGHLDNQNISLRGER